MDIIKTLQEDQGLWDHFTRKEEYTCPIRDQFDRFPYYASSDRNIFDPLASGYLIERGYEVTYPDKKTFAVCLTHDIDTIYTSMVSKLVSAWGHLRRKSYSGCLNSVAQIRSKKIPLWNFKDILALEERYDARSTFFFMVQEPGDQDYFYDIEDCETVIGELSDRGMDIGLHGGHTTYKNRTEMKEKKQRLEKITNKGVIGYRNHYLRFQVPDTFEYLSGSGFQYDSTLGYADCIGFRNGMCHPFKPYNRTIQREIDILEIPLNIMDDTLDNYMKMDAGTSWEMIKLLIDTVEKYHGILTVCWHNDAFFGDKRVLYEKILRYCSEKNAWMTSGSQIVTWVKQSG